MMGPLQNAMRLQALRATSDQAAARVGIISSYEPATFSVRVKLQPEGFITGWLPLCSPWIGNAWGMFAAPSIGDMVTVHFFGDALESGFVEGRLYNDVDRAVAVPSGEFWLIHKSGSFLKFTNDGNVSIRSQADLVATVGGNLNATVTGNVSATVSGNVTASVTGSVTATAGSATVNATTTVNGNTTINGNLAVNGTTTLKGPITQAAGGTGTAASLIGPLTVTNDVTGGGKSLQTHVHGGVTTGTGNTGAPV